MAHKLYPALNAHAYAHDLVRLTHGLGLHRYPVILIMIYNVGDFIGKMTPVVFPASSVTAPVTIFASAAARLTFVPAFFFAARSGIAPLVMVLTALLVRTQTRFADASP